MNTTIGTAAPADIPALCELLFALLSENQAVKQPIGLESAAWHQNGNPAANDIHLQFIHFNEKLPFRPVRGFPARVACPCAGLQECDEHDGYE